MPPPIPVELVPHSQQWAERAAEEATRLKATLGDVLVTVHHIGSTSIPAIVAKPIVDLMLEATSLTALDAAKADVVALGYEWHGEYGIPGRRYCTLNDPPTSKRSIHLHCFAAGSSQIVRHLAFRDYMRRHRDKARAYEAEKLRARDLHPNDSHAYTDAKSAWIRTMEAEALAAWHEESAGRK